MWLCLLFLLNLYLLFCCAQVAFEQYDVIPKEHSSEFLYALDETRVCKLKLLDHAKIAYTIQNYHESVQNQTWWIPTWKLIYSCHTDDYSMPTPKLSFWYNNGPQIVLEQCGEEKRSILYSTTESGVEISTYDFSFDALAYDYVTEQVYVYNENRLFKMKPETFLTSLLQNGWEPALKHGRYPIAWTDVMVVNGTIYYIFENDIYSFDNITSKLLSRTNSDKFPYILLPRTSSIASTIIPLQEQSTSSWLIPPKAKQKQEPSVLHRASSNNSTNSSWLISPVARPNTPPLPPRHTTHLEAQLQQTTPRPRQPSPPQPRSPRESTPATSVVIHEQATSVPVYILVIFLFVAPLVILFWAIYNLNIKTK